MRKLLHVPMYFFNLNVCIKDLSFTLTSFNPIQGGNQLFTREYFQTKRKDLIKLVLAGSCFCEIFPFIGKGNQITNHPRPND